MKSVEFSYNTGNFTGSVYNTTVSIGEELNFTMPIGAATSMKGFPERDFDGILGLGFDSNSEIYKSTGISSSFTEIMASSKQITSGVIGFYFSNYMDRDVGQVTFGGIDESKTVKKEIQYFDLDNNNKTLWTIGVETISYRIGDTKIKRDIETSPSSALIDTGSTLIMLDRSAADLINKELAATLNTETGIYTLEDCLADNKPELDVILNGHTFTIPPSAYIVKDSSVPGKITCASGVATFGNQEKDTKPDYLILGSVFLRTYYSVFDQTNNRIGFVKALHPSIGQ